MDEGPNPLEERPFVGELGDALRSAVEQVRSASPPEASQTRALGRARRLGPGKVNPWLRYHRIAVAASVAAVLLLTFSLLLVCWRFEPPAPLPVALPGTGVGPASDGGDDKDPGVPVDVDHGPAHRRPDGPAGADGRPSENPFVAVERSPVSTFPLTVDPAAYADVRRALLEEKRLPAPDAVGVADLVNSFAYSYPEPSGSDPASLTLDLAECPWDAAHQLARVGVRGRTDAAVLGAEVQVVFNPRRVAAYRLIGYEGRGGRPAGPSGETLAPGRAVTALYEIVPAVVADDAEWLTVKMRYLDSQYADCVLSRSLSGPAKTLAEAPADFRFAAAAAEFGLLLRDSAYKGRASYAAVRTAARAAAGPNPDDRRAEFFELLDAADRLTSDGKVTQSSHDKDLFDYLIS